MKNMRTAKTISITLPPELLLKAQEIAAREHRTMSELFREAIRRYKSIDPEWEALMDWGRAHGKALGITSEEDVERMSDEWRQERRQAAAR
jgi:predicted transcriptional regulator